MAIISQKKSYKKFFVQNSLNICLFPKKLIQENWNVSILLIYAKYPRKKVYGNILDSKKAFLDWKNKELKKYKS